MHGYGIARHIRGCLSGEWSPSDLGAIRRMI
jgi:hypothetical protein